MFLQENFGSIIYKKQNFINFLSFSAHVCLVFFSFCMIIDQFSVFYHRSRIRDKITRIRNTGTQFCIDC
jgi:hypothetical protein